MRRLKLILLFRSITNDDIKLRELLKRFGLLERFTPYVSGGRGAVRGEEARRWLEDRRNEAIAEVTLVVSMVAMVAAIVAAVRRWDWLQFVPTAARSTRFFVPLPAEQLTLESGC